MTGTALIPWELDETRSTLSVPPSVHAAGIIEDLLRAEIRNPHTRRAYVTATADFFRAVSRSPGVTELASITPIHVADWIERMQASGRAAPTIKQRLAAVRRIFQLLAARCIIPADPTAVVRGPAYSARRGKTPVLGADEARSLLDAIDTSTIVGLRDRALIATMVYTFARIGAVTRLKREDVFVQQRRLWLWLSEKRGKRQDVPCHHTLEAYLADYLAAGAIAGPDAWLFQTCDRPLLQAGEGDEGGKREWRLSGRPMSQPIAWSMVRRRAADAGIDTAVCNHTFRATGITTYLKNGGTIERAAAIAGHASTRTTQLYDRRPDDVTLDEIERIQI